jgi:hypothetical protein
VMLAEMSKKEEEWRSGAYPLCRCTFCSPRRAATPSCASARRRWIECWEKLHRAAWLLEEDDDEGVCGPAASGPSGWAAVAGLRPGKCFSLFFCFFSVLFILLFSLFISNSNLLICFAGIWLYDHL